MRFWDSSALVPLVVEEPTSKRCRDLLRRDRSMLVWCTTPIEMLSALSRRVREGALREADFHRAADRLELLAPTWTEIDAVGPCRDVAARLLRVHPLRAADALQLAAALVAFDGKPRRRPFVTLDAVLGTAASREGFETIAPK